MAQGSRWQRLFVYRKESLKTTWTCRLAILLLAILIGSLTRGYWTPWIGRSLVCTEELGPSDAILVENLDQDYLVFEGAAVLQQAGLSARVLVPTVASRSNPRVANAVDRGIAELMARVARLQNPEIIPILEDIEPISLNSAYEIRDFLTKEHLRSVIVVAPAFRSKRSFLIYRAVLTPVGIQVYCVPVFGKHTPGNWTTTWHGIQDVMLQFVKLQFYRFDVLPRAATNHDTGRADRSTRHLVQLRLEGQQLADKDLRAPLKRCTAYRVDSELSG